MMWKDVKLLEKINFKRVGFWWWVIININDPFDSTIEKEMIRIIGLLHKSELGKNERRNT